MNRRVVLIRHGDDPPDDRVVVFLHENRIPYETRKPFKGEALSDVDESVAAGVVYGGPFVVTETRRHPFLLDEDRWIEACMRHEVPLLGICQGAQSIAHVLGAEVGPLPDNSHEFGFYPIYATERGRRYFPAMLHVTQSHFHGFELPHGAELLAAGDTFPNQAFRYGKLTFGFQFHAEVTPSGFKRWQAADWAHYGKPGAQSKARQDALAERHDAAQRSWFNGFMQREFLRLILDSASA